VVRAGIRGQSADELLLRAEESERLVLLRCDRRCFALLAQVTAHTADLRCSAKIRSKLRGSDTDEPMKHPGKVAGVLESDTDAGLPNSEPLTSQKFFGAVDPLQEYKTMRRSTHAFLEQLTKVMGTHARQCSEIRELDFIGQVLADVVEHALQTVSGQAPSEE